MSLEDVKLYLRVDYSEDDTLINELIEIAQIYIDECVGEAYKLDVKAVKLAEIVQKKLIKDMYDNRTSYINESKKDRVVETILHKLSLLSSEV